MLSALACLAAMVPHGFHAVLISYADSADQSSVNDCRLITESLVRSGWGRSEIAYYNGHLEGGSLSFLSREVENARAHPLLVYVSGPAKAEPQTLTASMGAYWRWADLMGVLSKAGPVALITDTGYANLLASWVAPNVCAMVEEATWRDLNQPRDTGTVVHNGETMRVGILSYIIAREIPFSRDMQELVVRVNKIKDSGSMAAIWAEMPRVRIIGRRNLEL